MRVAHISDIHFGSISRPSIVDDLITDVNDARVDLVAVSGDLTQRANHKQFRACKEMLGAFSAPVLVVPGNHDVFPWWKPIARLTKPLSRFKEYLGPEMVRSFELDGVAILGVNSAHGKTIKGGRLCPDISKAIERYFTSRHASEFKVLMLHHHLAKISALRPHDVIKDAARHLKIVFDAGVDLILCGHIHISHVETLDSVQGRSIVVASAGTATSSRGRRSNRRRNYYNLIDISAHDFTVEERAYSSVECVYFSEKSTYFKRV